MVKLRNGKNFFLTSKNHYVFRNVKTQIQSLNYHFNCRTNAPVSDRITHRLQIIVSSLFHRIFSLEVYDVRTLFCLFVAMTTNFHQGLDHPLERIYLVIPYNEIAGFFYRGKNICFFPFFYFSLSCHDNKNKNKIFLR